MPLLRPHTRTRLVELLDRPLGFYLTVALGVCGAKVGWDLHGTRGALGDWPAPALAVMGFVFMILLACVLLALMYFAIALVFHALRWAVQLARVVWRGLRSVLLFVLDTIEGALT
jgi:uncharacterized membrane protein YeaQ/YmgE (transglycosylase-associated protein family)